MEFYEVIRARRTVRDFADRAVPDEVLLRIIDAGMRAPTNDHMRSWEFVVLTDRERIAAVLSKIPKKVSDKRLEYIFKMWRIADPCQKAMYTDGIPKQYAMLASSGCLVLPLFRQHSALLEPRSLSQLNGFASVWCCVENMLLAAAAEGLGAALRIPFDDEIPHIAKTVGFPSDYVMPCYLAFGYPSDEAPKIAQIEPEVESRIHRNQW